MDQLTPTQRRELNRLWFIYGNHGAKHSDAGHKFLQGLIEHGEDLRDFYGPSAELVALVDQVLTNE